jgi:hypothetical protein
LFVAGQQETICQPGFRFILIYPMCEFSAFAGLTCPEVARDLGEGPVSKPRRCVEPFDFTQDKPAEATPPKRWLSGPQAQRGGSRNPFWLRILKPDKVKAFSLMLN